MGRINREDMLELTRRMILERNCSDGIAETYFDEDYVNGTINRHYQRIVVKDQQKILLLGTKNREDIKGLSVDVKEMEVSTTMIKTGNC